MVPLLVQNGAIDDEQRRNFVFNGGLILFKNVPGVEDLGNHIRSLAEEKLDCADPTIAHRKYGFDEYASRVTELQKTVSGSSLVRETMRNSLKDLGVDLATTGHSRFTMRVQPPKESHISRNTTTLGPHRDSWYCEDYAQTNWWTPWYKLEPGRALQFYTRHWKHPVANTSPGWRLDEFRRKRAEATAAGKSFEEVVAAYPPVRVLDDLSKSPVIALIPEPGDLLCFSLAHLHEGPSNSTERCRFSTDFRTLSSDDIRRDLGAPNVDSGTSGTSIDDFQVFESGKPLRELLPDAPSQVAN